MAWRSSGATNNAMVDNLKRYRVIRTPAVEAAFRAVDRRFFVPQTLSHLSHTDQPLREGEIHISAPHMYGTIMEALNVQEGMTVLNLGSGTGYVCALTQMLMGPTGVGHGLELSETALQHCSASLQRWGRDHTWEFVHGNMLDMPKEQQQPMYDRIYVGAAVRKTVLKSLVGWLKVGGVSVAPVEDELIKVTRIGLCTSDDFLQETLSQVHFSEILTQPHKSFKLPRMLVWSFAKHDHFPTQFRHASETLLLCSSAPRRVVVTNDAALLPRAVWMHVLEFCSRDWFDKTQNTTETIANQLRNVQRERDHYRRLALKCQARISMLLDNSTMGTGVAAAGFAEYFSDQDFLSVDGDEREALDPDSIAAVAEGVMDQDDESLEGSDAPAAEAAGRTAHTRQVRAVSFASQEV